MSENSAIAIPEKIIANKIVTIRNERLILDVHLADFYGVETRVLKQAVRRNKARFPNDFMYELTSEEIDYMVSQNVIPSKKYFGGAVPFAFTENGVAMLSGILNSKKAIDVSISIIRAFTTLRRTLSLHKDILREVGAIKKQLKNHDDQILLIFEYLKKEEKSKQQKLKQSQRRSIGYKIRD